MPELRPLPPSQQVPSDQSKCWPLVSLKQLLNPLAQRAHCNPSSLLVGPQGTLGKDRQAEYRPHVFEFLGRSSPAGFLVTSKRFESHLRFLHSTKRRFVETNGFQQARYLEPLKRHTPHRNES